MIRPEKIRYKSIFFFLLCFLAIAPSGFTSYLPSVIEVIRDKVRAQIDLYAHLVSTASANETDVPASIQREKILILQVDGVINPVVASYLRKGFEKAGKEKAGLIIIQLDTPGGLDKSMRLIIKDMLSSEIPVVVFVGPSGSRAASAGTFIAFAAHVAAMSPGSNIGAAHPVQMGGQMDEEMSKKVENDAAAYIKSLAEKRHRNADWAEKAVRESVSVSEKDALELNVIDLIASDLTDLIEKLDGREVTMDKGKVSLRTKEQEIEYVDMSYSQRILDAISDPTLAYILLMLGFYGLFFELASPGLILPGIFGAIALILGLYSLQTLPVNYAGLLLLILALILFLTEVFVTSYGALTIGGIISMILGSLMLFDSSAPYMRVSLKVILAFTLGTAGLFTFLIGAAARAMLRKPATGFEGMMGQIGIAKTQLNPRGFVFTHGELWTALSQDGIVEKGETVDVIGRDGFTLYVKKKGDQP